MRTQIAKRRVHTIIELDDRARLHKLLRSVVAQVRLEPLLGERQIRSAEVWARLVSQVCVMGSARGMEELARDQRRLAVFRRDLSLRELQRHGYRVRYIAAVLSAHHATRFPKKAAARLRQIIDAPSAVRDGRCVLLTGLRTLQEANEIRDLLMQRCPVFKLKSAADYMIGAGLSHDVIALDVRVVGALKKHFGFNLEAARVQARRDVYLSVESALRDVCLEVGQPLALLDRALFQLSGMSALEFVMRASYRP